MSKICILTTLLFQLALGSADACECDRTSDDFLNWIDERTHIYRAELISAQDTIEVYPFWSRIFITFQVIDLVFGKMSVDTLRVLRPDDLGCTQWFSDYSIGDIWILKGEFVEIVPTSGFGHSMESLGVYFTLIPCDVTYLNVRSNQVEGAIIHKCGRYRIDKTLRHVTKDNEEKWRHAKLQHLKPCLWSYHRFIRYVKRATRNIRYSGSEKIIRTIDS